MKLDKCHTRVLVVAMGWMLGLAQGVLAQAPTKLEVRGRLVDLTPDAAKSDSPDKPAAPAKAVGLRTKEGTVHRLVRNPDSEALFTDQRLWAMNLVLTGFRAEDGRALEVSLVRSIRDGKVYDVYYWCEICAIKTVTPGPCPCCRDDVELRESLLESPSGPGHTYKRRDGLG